MTDVPEPPPQPGTRATQAAKTVTLAAPAMLIALAAPARTPIGLAPEFGILFVISRS